MKTQCLSLLVLVAIWRQTAAITNCYVCGSTIGPDGIEKNNPTTDPGSCFLLTGKTAVANSADLGCATTYTKSGSTTTISRAALTSTIAATPVGCTASASGPGITCSCATDKCNADPVAAALTYDCYECQSVDYFDNGCGATLNTASVYVRTVKGCSACNKNVAVQSDHSILYTRTCLRSISIDAQCDGETYEIGGQTCTCKGGLCNSADTVSVKSVTTFFAVFLAAVFKLMY